jgi:hypothetical protein
VTAFYEEHPELFSQRKVYRLQELVIDAKQEQFSQIEADIKGLANINEVANLVRNKKYPFNVNTNVKSAEQLPAKLLKDLYKLKDGDLIILNSGKTLNVVSVVATKDASLKLADAKPVIQQYFNNKNRSELIKTELDTLRKKAEINYLGDFAEMQNKPIAKSVLANTEKESLEKKIDKTESVSNVKPKENVLDKGLKGL